MVGYIYVFYALVGGLLKGFASKKISNDIHSFRDCVYVNFIRMVFCIFIGIAVIMVSGDFGMLRLEVRSLWFYLFSASSLVAFCICFLFAYRVSAYMYLSTFTMLGTVITCFLDYAVYDAKISN